MSKKETPLGQFKALDRYLSPLDVWAMAFGCMVGWGVFAMPGTTFLPVAGPAGTMIAMLIGMLIMLIIGNNFSFLLSRSSMATLDAGMEAHIAKPIDVDVLMKTLTDVLLASEKT